MAANVDGAWRGCDAAYGYVGHGNGPKAVRKAIWRTKEMERQKIEERMRGLPLALQRIIDFRTPAMTPPNRIIFGFRAADQVGAEAAKMVQGREAIIISDATLERLKTIDPISSSLSLSGFSVRTFARVEPEPHIETAEAIHEMCRACEFSVMVAVGGGSVMDIAKLSAQAAGRKRSPRDYVERKATPDGPGLPLIVLPTTSGTGSEVSFYLVCSVGEEKRFFFDPYYFANMAIVDPLLTVSMPPSVTAGTGIDALTHAVEGMMHRNANPLGDSFGLASVEMIGKYLRRAVADGEDLEARYYMAMAASLSMMAMMLAGGLYSHSVSYILPMYKFTPHGVGCGLGLPYLMDYNLPVITGKLARIAGTLGERTWMLSEIDAAKRAVHAVAQLIKDTGLPLTLEEYGGLRESDLEEMADRMMALYPRPMNPRPMGRKESIQYWRGMWEGRL
jgi:alcohol dehydrogenase class IV